MPRAIALVGVSIAAVSCSRVDALPSFLKLVPGSSNVPGVYAIGHVLTGGGGDRNQFGKDFESNGKKWSQELCYKDSDKDGQFNGAELGDPCCEWVEGSNEKLAYTNATAPGDPSSKQSPDIWANVTCADGRDPVTKFVAINGNQTSNEPQVGDNDATPAPTPKAAVTTSAPTQKSAAPRVHTAALVLASAVAMGVVSVLF